MKRVIVSVDDCRTSAKWFDKNPLFCSFTEGSNFFKCIKDETLASDIYLKDMESFVKKDFEPGKFYFFHIGSKINTPLEICREIRKLAIETELKQ